MKFSSHRQICQKFSPSMYVFLGVLSCKALFNNLVNTVNVIKTSIQSIQCCLDVMDGRQNNVVHLLRNCLKVIYLLSYRYTSIVLFEQLCTWF